MSDLINKHKISPPSTYTEMDEERSQTYIPEWKMPCLRETGLMLGVPTMQKILLLKAR